VFTPPLIGYFCGGIWEKAPAKFGNESTLLCQRPPEQHRGKKKSGTSEKKKDWHPVFAAVGAR